MNRYEIKRLAAAIVGLFTVIAVGAQVPTKPDNIVPMSAASNLLGSIKYNEMWVPAKIVTQVVTNGPIAETPRTITFPPTWNWTNSTIPLGGTFTPTASSGYYYPGGQGIYIGPSVDPNTRTERYEVRRITKMVFDLKTLGSLVRPPNWPDTHELVGEDVLVETIIKTFKKTEDWKLENATTNKVVTWDGANITCTNMTTLATNAVFLSAITNPCFILDIEAIRRITNHMSPEIGIDGGVGRLKKVTETNKPAKKEKSK
jgi:hypothetical protein